MRERQRERGKGGPHPRPRARGLRSRRDMQTQNGRALARPPAGKGILSVRGPQSEAEPSSFLNGRSSVARTTKRGKTRARGRPRPSLIGDDADNFVSYRHSLEPAGWESEGVERPRMECYRLEGRSNFFPSFLIPSGSALTPF